MSDTTIKEAGTIQVMLQRLNEFRLPKALDLKKKVDRGVEVQSAKLVGSLALPDSSAGGISPRADHGKNVLRLSNQFKACRPRVSQRAGSARFFGAAVRNQACLDHGSLRLSFGMADTDTTNGDRGFRHGTSEKTGVVARSSLAAGPASAS